MAASVCTAWVYCADDIFEVEGGSLPFIFRSLFLSPIYPHPHSHLPSPSLPSPPKMTTRGGEGGQKWTAIEGKKGAGEKKEGVEEQTLV